MHYKIRKTHSGNWALCYWGRVRYGAHTYFTPFWTWQWIPMIVGQDLEEIIIESNRLKIKLEGIDTIAYQTAATPPDGWVIPLV